MKGLLIKDMRYTLRNKKIIIGCFLVALILVATQVAENASFIIGYMTMVSGMLVLNIISSDEYDKSNAFLMTMPVNCDIYAMEKYLFSIGCSLIGWLIGTIICFILQRNQALETLVQAVVIFLVLSLFQLIMLPIQLKYGGEKGRMVLVGMIAFIMSVIFMFEQITKMIFPSQTEAEEVFLRLMNWLSTMNKWVFGLLICFGWLICFSISLTISKKIIKKKEF